MRGGRIIADIDPHDGTADPGPTGDAGAVAAANHAFYEAFEAGDLDAMSDVWEHTDRVSCGHPGWEVLLGWSRVAASWAALFSSGDTLQFILTNAQVHVHGDMAWVTVDENILAGPGGSTVASINVFVRSGGGWLMVAHHGSVVADRRGETSP